MSAERRICIIGAGAVGLTSALQLARRGAGSVTVLEAAHPAAGSSGLSVGIVETQYTEPLDIALRVWSMGFFDALERDHGLHLTRNGYLRLGHDGPAAAVFERSVATQRELGVADARVLDAGEIRRLIPDMRADDVVCGLFGPRDGFLDGHLYCGLLAELATELGVEIVAGAAVTGADTESDGTHVLHTRRGEHRCDVVVNAAGPWADRVGELLGAPAPLDPQRHEAVVVHLPRPLEYVMPSVMDYTPGTGRNGLYFRHERPGQLIAGLHSEEALEAVPDVDHYARSASPDFLEGVAELLSDRLPSLDDAALAHGWAGLYPVSTTGLPQIGPVPGRETVISAAGAGGSGMQLSPVLGELVADWVIAGEPLAVPGAAVLAPRAEVTVDR
jgi:sarcosine oxidase subunit beta